MSRKCLSSFVPGLIMPNFRLDLCTLVFYQPAGTCNSLLRCKVYCSPGRCALSLYSSKQWTFQMWLWHESESQLALEDDSSNLSDFLRADEWLSIFLTSTRTARMRGALLVMNVASPVLAFVLWKEALCQFCTNRRRYWLGRGMHCSRVSLERFELFFPVDDGASRQHCLASFAFN